ncbi:MAG: hypothetical protein K6F80_06730 [Oscillospiraceae bacterium]|nr:hypothetical protein [Oscillospiraceae bacterium]
MRDILNVMWFDFLTTKPIILPVFAVIAVMCGVMGLFFSPLMYMFVVMAAVMFIVPLEAVADKSGFHKLYGILPVSRKNITRGRFQFLFWVLFIVEIFSLLMVKAAVMLQLYRLLPNQNTETMQLVAATFNEESSNCFSVIAGIFVVMCLGFAYMQMMGQIFGQENEMKIVMITLAALTVGSLAFFQLDAVGIIPHITFLPDFDAMTSRQRILYYIGMNLATFGITTVFGEITAAKIAKREL